MGETGIRGQGVSQASNHMEQAQAKASIIGVGIGCLCHLDKGRPVEQGPRDEA